MYIKCREAYIKNLFLGLKSVYYYFIILQERPSTRKRAHSIFLRLAVPIRKPFQTQRIFSFDFVIEFHSAWGLYFVPLNVTISQELRSAYILNQRLTPTIPKKSYSPNASAYFKTRIFANQRGRLQSCQNMRSGKDEMSFVHEVGSYWTWARPSKFLPPLSMGPKSFWEMV